MSDTPLTDAVRRRYAEERGFLADMEELESQLTEARKLLERSLVALEDYSGRRGYMSLLQRMELKEEIHAHIHRNAKRTSVWRKP